METDTEVQSETVTTPTPETQPEQTADTTAFTQDDVNRIVNERLERERAKQAKAQETATAEAARKALEDNQEFKTLYETEKAQREAVEQENKTIMLNNTRRDIAAKIGIPNGLVSRLQGSTAEEIEADAASLMASLPKVTPPSLNGGAGGGNAGNPKFSDVEIQQMAVKYGVSVESMKKSLNQ